MELRDVRSLDCLMVSSLSRFLCLMNEGKRGLSGGGDDESGGVVGWEVGGVGWWLRKRLRSWSGPCLCAEEEVEGGDADDDVVEDEGMFGRGREGDDDEEEEEKREKLPLR